MSSREKENDLSNEHVISICHMHFFCVPVSSQLSAVPPPTEPLNGVGKQYQLEGAGARCCVFIPSVGTVGQPKYFVFPYCPSENSHC